MTTFEKLKKIISEQLYVDESKITMDSDIVEDFEADSIEMVDIVMDIEDEFGVEIPVTLWKPCIVSVMLSNTSTQISNIPNIHCPR